VELVFRPIKDWPGTLRTDAERQQSPFSAGWNDTQILMDREVYNLGGERVIVELGLTEKDIRLDGGVRADRIPSHPGCIVSFDSRHGPLRYWTDLFTHVTYRRQQPAHGWRQNFRAIALGLEALRKVDRYGIANAGQQYTGWKEIGSGIAMGTGEPPWSVEEAAAFISENSVESPLSGRPCFTPEEVLLNEGKRKAAYRLAARRLHPDAGGDPAAFRRLEHARRIVEATP
jgi:hypothetical protein